MIHRGGGRSSVDVGITTKIRRPQKIGAYKREINQHRKMEDERVASEEKNSGNGSTLPE